METTAISGGGASYHQGLSQARSPGQSEVDAAVDLIHRNLDESGLFNDVTHAELREINETIEQLNPDQRNSVISRLSDQALGTWAEEINSNGILGTGGLSADERHGLFTDLAAGLDIQQMGRVYSAFGDSGSKAELAEATGAAMTTDEVQAAISDRAAAMPAGSSRTQLENYSTSLEQLQYADQMAAFATDSYQDFATAAPANTLQSGTRRLNPDQLPPELGITRDDLIDDASGYHAAVYQQGQGDEATYVVAFRGTEDGTDWMTNLGSGAGFKTTQFSRADGLVRKLVRNVGAENVAVTGHSLGGGLSNYAALKNEVQSTAFNPKGTTWSEQREIGNMDELAAQYVHNYQVVGEILTGAQETADALTILPGKGVQDLLKEAPGPVTKLPAIRPDGSSGNMLLEAAQKGLMFVSPFHDAGNHDISGPVDRHGMDYVNRGVEAQTESVEAAALSSLFASFD
jgi:hypothetical protein